MQTKTEPLTELPRPAAAANHDFAMALPSADMPARPRVAGWDPYEVWRTRVKAIQDSWAGEGAVR
jgi:hypothetical protein